MHRKKKKILWYFFRLYKILREYDVVHINGNSATLAVDLLAASIAGVSIRISHSHTTRTNYPLLHSFLLPIFKKSYTVGLACSDEAGKWLFGKGKFSVLKNAIDVGKYKYSTIRSFVKQSFF